MSASSSSEDVCLSDYKYMFQPDILQGKVAFISGGGSGIGFRIAEVLMRHGCRTVIASRRVDKITQSASLLTEATKVECHPIQLDVRKYDSVKKAMEETVQRFGSIDYLVNSAAGNFLCPVSGMSSNAFKTVIEIDTIGTFHCTKAAYDVYMKDHGGAIINISATIYYTGTPLQAHAGSAKAAIDALTKHLAVEWGSQNIRVNSVSPGATEGTPGFHKLGGSVDKSAVESHIPLGRIGTRTEMAEACLFLLSPLSSYTTGTVLVVDGGQWMASSSTYSSRIQQSKL